MGTDHTSQCRQCQASFDVTDEDMAFYEKISPVFGGTKYLIPPPSLCPDCRWQRRMIWRREHALKNRECSLCGKNIVSIHTADAPYPVYCVKCFWSEGRDARSYGREIDLERPFGEQFSDLLQAVPQIAMMNDNGIGSENCEYCQDFSFGKNCYLNTGTWEVEDCYYCDCNILQSKFLVDCYGIHYCEFVYESLASERLYRCAFLNHCENCSDCWFGVDLKGCKNCIACIGLRHKEYCIFNKQCTKEEYERERAELRLDTYEGMTGMWEKYFQWILPFPRKALIMSNCENCIGDDLFNCKDVVVGFQFDGAEYCKFVVHGDSPKNCYDVSQTGRPEWCYEGATPDNSYMTHFTTWCWKDKYVLYSDNCHSCEHLFGCIGMKRSKYCILNKQYTKEEYDALVPQIIEGMKNDGGGAMNRAIGESSGSWGEFWPMQMSPYCYNETAAQENFPLIKEEALGRGLRWRDEDTKAYKPQTYKVPSRITDVRDDIMQAVLACTSCSKNFKILPQELEFYRTMQIPVPRTCYDCRYGLRIKQRNPRKLWERECMKCGKKMQTSYAPERPEIVYCELCYLESVY